MGLKANDFFLSSNLAATLCNRHKDVCRLANIRSVCFVYLDLLFMDQHVFDNTIITVGALLFPTGQN